MPSIDISIRAARSADSDAIARFICIAGEGLYEFLFDDMIPFVTAVDFLAAGVSGEDYPISYRNCCVAVDEATDEIVGAANAFPADLLSEERYALLPSERQEHIRSLLRLQDWGSMLLNSLAVSESHRGRGIGGRLLAWARDLGMDNGFDRLSLHVWADNLAAQRLYRAHGFVELGVADVAPHPRLPHVGGSILMRLAIAR